MRNKAALPKGGRGFVRCGEPRGNGLGHRLDSKHTVGKALELFQVLVMFALLGAEFGCPRETCVQTHRHI
jgi:hypothetical protein